MTILITCIFLACLLPYLTKIPVFYAMHKLGYDNNHPRTQQESLTGFGARALAAHKNSFESLLIFLAAALTALATQNYTPIIQGLAIFYIFSRIIYSVLYLANYSSMRSIVWATGTITCLTIIIMCLP